LISIAGFFFLFASAPGQSRELEILGWVENTYLPGPDITVKAKLDTGADTSSLDVEVVKKFRKDNKRWVRFRMVDRESGEEHVLVKERVRTASIVRHDGSRQSRPVVLMQICIAGLLINTEVSLIDRSEFVYPLLLGRKALAEVALVDPGSTYLTSPDCGLQREERSAES
jgi:hypothetical protein